MRERIRAELEAAERMHDAKVLLAVESGSRCWGLASDHSDWDVRFVYMRRKEDYLRLESTRDTIEQCIDGEFDIVGWDVAKLLRLLRSSNPTAFEWLGSRTVYCEDVRFCAVRDVAQACFDPCAIAHHYLNMAMKHGVRYLRNGRATLKRYLHTVRALLGSRWAVWERHPVPMRFDELCDSMLEPALQPLVNTLAESKRAGLEGEWNEDVSELDAWIATASDELVEEVARIESRERVPWKTLDEVFLKVLG